MGKPPLLTLVTDAPSGPLAQLIKPVLVFLMSCAWSGRAMPYKCYSDKPENTMSPEPLSVFY